MTTRNATPLTIVIEGEISETGVADGEKAMSHVESGPVMKLASIAAPVVALYSPTVPKLLFATKRVLPDNASASWRQAR